MNYVRTEDNGLAFNSLCMLETDRWLLHLVVCYGAILGARTDQINIGPYIEAFLETMPRVCFVVKDNIETFNDFLDLPLWEKRHEFFSA